MARRRARRVNQDVVQLLRDALEDALDGVVVGVFIVTKYSRFDYAACYDTDDLPDMVYQVRTEALRALEEPAKPN